MMKKEFSCWMFLLVTVEYVTSYTPKQCDIRFWHMDVMEHLFTWEREMTSIQISTLGKVEQMMERVQGGSSPLVPCSLLSTYSNIVVPEIGQKLIEELITKTEEVGRESAIHKGGNISKDNRLDSESEVDGAGVGHSEGIGEDGTGVRHSEGIEDDSVEKRHSEGIEEDGAEKRHFERIEEDPTEVRHSEEIEEDGMGVRHSEGIEEDPTEVRHSKGIEDDSAEKRHSEGIEEDGAEKRHFEGIEENGAEKRHSEEIEEDSTEISHPEEAALNEAGIRQAEGTDENEADHKPAEGTEQDSDNDKNDVHNLSNEIRTKYDKSDHGDRGSGGVVYFFDEEDEDHDTIDDGGKTNSDENGSAVNEGGDFEDTNSRQIYENDVENNDDEDDEDEEMLVLDAYGNFASSSHSKGDTSNEEEKGASGDEEHAGITVISSRDSETEKSKADNNDGVVIFYDESPEDDDEESTGETRAGPSERSDSGDEDLNIVHMQSGYGDADDGSKGDDDMNDRYEIDNLVITVEKTEDNQKESGGHLSEANDGILSENDSERNTDESASDDKHNDAEDNSDTHEDNDKSTDESEINKKVHFAYETPKKMGIENPHDAGSTEHVQNGITNIRKPATVANSYGQSSKPSLSIVYKRNCVSLRRVSFSDNTCEYLHILLHICDIYDLHEEHAETETKRIKSPQASQEGAHSTFDSTLDPDGHTETTGEDNRAGEHSNMVNGKFGDNDEHLSDNDEYLRDSDEHLSDNVDNLSDNDEKVDISRSTDNSHEVDFGKHETSSQNTDVYTGKTDTHTKYHQPSNNPSFDYEKIELMLGKRESEHAAKIQGLELMLVKLENKLLTQSMDKQTDSHAFSALENQILRLENELLKLNQSYQKLQEDHEALNARTGQFSSGLQEGEAQLKPKYLALPDNSSTELMTQQQVRITELNRLIQNQSSLIHKIQSKSEYLEDRNRKLFQIVMNQTALISHIMGQVQGLSEEGLTAKIQAEEFKSRLERLKETQTSEHNLKRYDQRYLLLQENESRDYDFAIDSSVKDTRGSSVRDLVTILLTTMRGLPKTHFPSMERLNSWKCNGQSSPRLCVFHSIIISNCTPFSDIYWLPCNTLPGGIILAIDTTNDSRIKNLPSFNVNMPERVGTHGEVNNLNDRTSREHDATVVSTMMQPPQNYESVTDDSRNIIPSVKHDTLLQEDSSASYEPEISSDGKKITQADSDEENLSSMLPTPSEKEQTLEAKESKLDIVDIADDFIQRVVEGDGEVNSNNADKRERAFVENSTPKDKDGDSSDSGSKISNVAYENASDKHKSSIESGVASTLESGQIQTKGETKFTQESSAQPENDSPACTSQPNAKPIAGDAGIECHALNQQPLEGTSDAKKGEEAKKLQKQMSDVDTKERRQAALEAKALHEAFHRRVLYEPLHREKPKDCYDLYKRGQQRSGMSQIYVSGLDVYVSVYCDMEKSGWTVLLKREDGSLDFYRDFEQYKDGFGAPRGEHYVGNDVIHHLTNQGHYALKAELTDWEDNTRHAHYDHFWIDGEEEGYQLHLLGYSGTAGDGLSKHSGMKFSTFDVDHDLLKTEMGGSCAKRFHGAGWYYKCYSSNLMGRYYKSSIIPGKNFDGIAWKPWYGPGYSLKSVTLAVRPFGVER